MKYHLEQSHMCKFVSSKILIHLISITAIPKNEIAKDPLRTMHVSKQILNIFVSLVKM